MMRKLFKPWVLVTVGVIMNILSALIVHTLVERNMNRMDVLMRQSNSVDLRIDTLWENYRRLERQQAYFTTLLLSANPGPQLDSAHELVLTALNELIERHTLKHESIDTEKVSLAQVQDIHAIVQRGLLESIDEIYLERIDVERRRQNIAENNERLRSIALFLQLLGLILVLARDLARRD